MSTKMKSLKVSHPWPTDHDNPETSSRYRVEQVTNSVEFSPGQLLTKKEIMSLCEATHWTVNTVPVPRNGGRP